MGGHDHPKLPKVPDWRIYKVEDVPQLMNVRKALALRNLKNPWLRNEVWKYIEYRNNPKVNVKWYQPMMKGFKPGLVAAIITTIIEKAYFGFSHDDHDDHDDYDDH